MSYETVVELVDVWKLYSTQQVFRGSIREEIAKLFKKGSYKESDEAHFWALSNINLNIKNGECVGIYGPNGSGKTTLLKLISSVTYPTKGKITVNGSVAPLLSVGVGFHMDLTGRENIYLNGTIIGMTIKQIKTKMDDIIEFSELEAKFIDMPVKKYSSGMRVRLGFSVAVHSDANILLLDEILGVGDRAFRNKCIEKIKSFREKKTIIIVLHDYEKLQEITNRIIHLKKGNIDNER